ncbi:MAG: replicative DNA helicase [Phycisphaerales bacterium]
MDEPTTTTAPGTASRGTRPARAAPRADIDRPPPYSLEAEMALLGALLLNPRVTPDVLSLVSKGEEFYSEAHGAIFRTLIEVYDRQPDADLVPILDALRDRGQLELIGGAEYLEKLAGETPGSTGATHYARIVADKAKLRRLIDAAEQIRHEAMSAGSLGLDGAREVLDRAEMMVFEIAQEDRKSDPQSLADLLQREVDRLEASEGQGISGLPTGFDDLDELLRGLQPGEMIILAARPSMGKTAMALNLAEQVARGGRSRWRPHAKGPSVGVGVFSLEMSKGAVAQRFLSAMSQVSSHELRSGKKFGDSEWKRIIEACGELKDCPVYIDDTPGLTVLQLRARARRMVAQHGVKAIIVDYLQLLTAPGSARESRQVEVSAISRSIKALARELNVPVVCLSQLNRASEQREGNRPRMSDLRESGSIEQDADVVMLLHREDYYHVGNPDWAAENPDKVGVAEIIVAKQRNGPTDVVRLTWDPNTTRFKAYGGHRDGGDDAFVRSRPAPARYGGAAEPAPLRSSEPAAPATGLAWGAPPAGAGAGTDAPFAGRSPATGAFAPRPPTGPAPEFRDGGGPDRDDDDAAPF